MTDGVDGSDIAGTMRFGLDGDLDEVDLSATNEQELRGFLEPLIQAGRRLFALSRSLHGEKPGVDSRAVRAWAAPAGSRSRLEVGSALG